jgi:3-methyladenine DNA glycosylase Tag
MTSLKTAWIILGSDHGSAEILSKKCRPNFDASTPDDMKFEVIYERFHFDGIAWQSMLIKEDGFWEAVANLDPNEFRAKLG